ncbi:MAG: hypothetical protein SCK29_05275 [Bacillota bacterium]|nr:hypothetical protein [Bacillota bacterium]MDW7683514.1 hypothetical protein [Bacillota bacterium]
MRGMLRELAAIATKEKTPLYIVGGFVRDGLLGRESRDVDLAVGYEAGQFAKRISWLLRGDYELLESQAQYSRVTLTGSDGRPFYLDFSLLRGESIAEDLKCRDFTVNAMAVSLDDYLLGPGWPEKVIDPCGGKNDLSARLLRVVGEESLRHDPVRLFRSARFMHKLGFELAADTAGMLRKNAPLIRQANKIKLCLELFQLLSQEYAAEGLRVLQEDIGVLGALYEPLAEMSETETGGEDLFSHGLQVCRCLDEILGGASGMDPTLRRKLAAHLHAETGENRSRITYLRLACVLHDIGKLGLSKGRIALSAKSFSHELAAEAYLTGLARLLRFCDEEFFYLSRLIGNHSRPLLMVDGEDCMTAKLRYFRQFADLAPDLILLAMANIAAREGCRADGVRQLESVLAEFFAGFFLELPEPILHAKELMEFFNLPPTRTVGMLLERLYAEQMAGTIKTKKSALSYVSGLLAKREKV